MRNTHVGGKARSLILVFFFIVLMSSFLCKVQGQLEYERIHGDDTAPPQHTPKNGDCNGDNIADWLLGHEIDDLGRSIELWVIDPDGDGGDVPFNDYYALIFRPFDAHPGYFVGKCPFEGGSNRGQKAHSGDVNGNGLPDRFEITVWESTDLGQKDDDGDGATDRWVYSFDVDAIILIATHWHNDEYIEEVRLNPPHMRPFNFEDLPPADPDNNATTVGKTPGYVRSTRADAGAVGGIVVPVDKFVLLAPYIGVASTIIAATAATAVYVKRVKHRRVKN